MDTRTLEIRDTATFIPVLAILMRPTCAAEDYLLARTGYVGEPSLVVLMPLGQLERTRYDPHSWGGRTFPVAHDYIQKNFHILKNGDVVDVRFILGEQPEPAISERFGSPF